MVLLCTVGAALGQSNQLGLIAIKASNTAEGMEKKPTTSRLFILSQIQEDKLPVLRLIITDKPFMVGNLSAFEGTIVTDARSNSMQTFRIPLDTKSVRETAFAQMVDVPITNGPVTQMLAAMFNSPPGATVAVDVVDADNPAQSKSYIVPAAALLELRRQYLVARAAK